MVIINNPHDPATSRQLWMLHRLTKEDTRGLTLTKQQASDKIGELLADKPTHNDAAPAAAKPGHLVKAGDYFHTSWGYDQTNIDYLVIASVSPSGKTAICRMAEAIQVDAEMTQDVLTPGPAWGVSFRMQVRATSYSGDAVALVGSYPYCVQQDSRRLGHFSPVKIGDLHRQTNPMSGH